MRERNSSNITEHLLSSGEVPRLPQIISSSSQFCYFVNFVNEENGTQWDEETCLKSPSSWWRSIPRQAELMLLLCHAHTWIHTCTPADICTTYLHTHIHVQTHQHTHAHIHTCTHIWNTYLHVHTYTYTHTRTHTSNTYRHTYICIHTCTSCTHICTLPAYTYTHLHTHMHIHTCTHLRILTCTHTCTHIHLYTQYISAYTHTHTCTHTHTSVHTHTHAYPQCGYSVPVLIRIIHADTGRYSVGW